MPCSLSVSASLPSSSPITVCSGHSSQPQDHHFLCVHTFICCPFTPGVSSPEFHVLYQVETQPPVAGLPLLNFLLSSSLFLDPGRSRSKASLFTLLFFPKQLNRWMEDLSVLHESYCILLSLFTCWPSLSNFVIFWLQDPVQHLAEML